MLHAGRSQRLNNKKTKNKKQTPCAWFDRVRNRKALVWAAQVLTARGGVLHSRIVVSGGIATERDVEGYMYSYSCKKHLRYTASSTPPPFHSELSNAGHAPSTCRDKKGYLISYLNRRMRRTRATAVHRLLLLLLLRPAPSQHPLHPATTSLRLRRRYPVATTTSLVRPGSALDPGHR